MSAIYRWAVTDTDYYNWLTRTRFKLVECATEESEGEE